MYSNNTRKNIAQFNTWLLPIIIASKIVRWTIMYKKLVAMSIGNGMIERMQMGSYHFRATVLSVTTSASSVAESNAGALYNAINFMGLSSTMGWEVYLTIILNILTYIFVKDFYERTPSAGKKENFFIYLSIAILNIFSFCLAKEPFQMLFFFLMAFAIKSGQGYRMKRIYLMGALFVTILFSRKYFGLILIYYFILETIVKQLYNVDFSGPDGKKKLIKNVIITAALIAVCHFFLLSFLSVNSEDTYSEMMSANYRDMNRSSVADSEIVPIFAKGNPILAAIDYGIKIFRLMFPIELLLKGKVTYIFLIVFQGMLAGFIAKAFINRSGYEEEEEEEEVEEESNVLMETEEEEEEEEEEDETDQDRREIRTAALYLYLAFLLCSAAFEPDFGSWIRHQSVTFPVMILML